MSSGWDLQNATNKCSISQQLVFKNKIVAISIVKDDHNALTPKLAHRKEPTQPPETLRQWFSELNCLYFFVCKVQQLTESVTFKHLFFGNLFFFNEVLNFLVLFLKYFIVFTCIVCYIQYINMLGLL